jgi:hypothetical protein
MEEVVPRKSYNIADLFAAAELEFPCTSGKIRSPCSHTRASAQVFSDMRR